MSRAMSSTQARGVAVALIENGQVVAVRSQGERNAGAANTSGAPLQTDTVMYAASLTKAMFAYLLMQLVDEGRIDLDRPIAEYLDRPLPQYPDDRRYGPWSGLAGDDRWRRITPRILLTHSSGFANFAFLEPDGRLRMHFDPGTRYGYSGDGIMLLQFVIEQGLGIDVQRELERRFFDRLGMTRTSATWRPDFAGNLADGWDIDGKPQPHDERSRSRMAGSIDTTIDDFARFAAAAVRGDGLSARARAEWVRAQLPITTAHQFPTWQLPELPVEQRRPDLAAGLGVVVFDGPQGRGFYKGGHDDITGNLWVCVERGKRCVVILSNDVRAERAYPALVRELLGETGMPWDWEYNFP